MKQDNAFNFVAIRGPERPPRRPRPPAPPDSTVPPDSTIPPGTPVPGDSSIPIPIGLADGAFVAEIRRQTDTGVSLGEAREAISAELLDSSDYVPRSTAWRGLLPLEAALAAVLAANPALDAAALRAGLEAVLTRHFGQGFDLKSFAQREDFWRMRTDLWHSYYANVALRTRRPQDRPLLEFWIRLFEVIANVADDCSQFTSAHVRALRPTIPFLLLVEKRPEPESPGAPVPPVRLEQIRRAQSALAELKAVEEELKCLRASRPAPQVRRPLCDRMPQPRQEGFRGEFDDPPEPLGFADGELTGTARKTLARECLDTGNQTLAEVLEAVRGRIAQAYLRLHGLRRVSEVVFSAGVFVRRRRRIPVEPASSEEEMQ